MSIYTINKFQISVIYKVIFLSVLLLIFTSIKISKALENKILIKLNNEIITTVDISKEISYLKAFNKKIEELDDIKIIEIAKNSIIKERIRKIEIYKFTKKLSIDRQYLDKMIETTYLKIGLSSLDQFINHLEYHDINIQLVEDKLTLDAYWKQIIYNKYKNKIKIDKEKILTEISNKKNKFYNISEIMFNVEKDEDLKKKYNLIKQSIDNNGFENSALIYSISESSKNGGNLGWINESAISSKIGAKLSLLKIGEITKPLIIPGGFLIIKVNNLKEENVEVDINKELEKVVDIKVNEQLNQFSNLYLNKIKKNIIINEL